MNLLAADFIFTDNFPGLNMGVIQDAIDWIEIQFTGCFSLWSKLSADQATKKRTFLEWNLVAWYLADQYPSYVTGVIADGAPIVSKTIGAGKGVSIVNRTIDVQEALIPLTSNGFGRRALTMITGSSDRMAIY